MSKYPVPAKIRGDLKSVEAQLASVVDDAGGALSEACASTLRAGGKRLRPALVLVCGTAGTYDLAALTPHAIAVELIHMASLVHDDILDGAPTRRGLPSVHAVWGEAIAVAAGDFLFSKAFEILAASGVDEAAAVLAAAGLDLTVGELMQREGAGRVDVRRTDYLERIKAKTASLFRASCVLGALAAEASRETRAALARYGEHLGMAFQIYDDVLDVCGESEILGKAVGADFRDGTVTLPMMLAVEQLGQDEWLRDTIGDPHGGEEKVSAALALMASTDAAARAKEAARAYVTSAVEAVSGLESARLRRTLTNIGNYVIQRYD